MIGYALAAGCPLSAKRFGPAVDAVNKAFATVLEGPVSAGVHDVVMVLHVSGSVSDYMFSGVDKAIFDRRKKRLSIDVGIAANEWPTLSDRAILAKLKTLARQCIEKMQAEIRDRKIDPPPVGLYEKLAMWCEAI